MHVFHSTASNRWTDFIVGLDQPMPVLGGRMVPYINLDNAATTPPLKRVVETVNRFLPYYSSVHRGAGFKSRSAPRRTTTHTTPSPVLLAPTER